MLHVEDVVLLDVERLLDQVLVAPRPDDAAEWLTRAAERYRESFADAPPGVEDHEVAAASAPDPVGRVVGVEPDLVATRTSDDDVGAGTWEEVVLLVAGACDWGPSDPIAVPRFVMEMRRRKYPEELIQQVVLENPVRFLSQSPKFRVPPGVESRVEVG